LSEHQLTELESGVRIVTEAMPSVRSAALGFFIGSGSRSEAPDEAGLSHLLEHLLFKGTPSYASAEIDEIFDSMGASINAETDKETTAVYARMLDTSVERAFAVMSEMVWAPSLAEIDAERQVVIEEIAMYEDDPQEKVWDDLGEAIWGEHPLGRPVIGRAQVIQDTPVDAIRSFHDRRYVGANVVVAAAGSIDHDEIVRLVRAAEELVPRGDVPAPAEPAPPGVDHAVSFSRKDTEQVHFCLGAPGIPRHDERRFALRVLDSILGGTSSSRLFQQVREERGLAYSVGSYVHHYADTGEVGIYLGTRVENLGAALAVVRDELGRLLEDGVTEVELERARENAKGRIVLALEASGARMSRLGAGVLHGTEILGPDEMIERLDAVSGEAVDALARELLAPEGLCAAGIGPDEPSFRAALDTFHERRAAA
jgi:predicted Zn-dependent peptidase